MKTDFNVRQDTFIACLIIALAVLAIWGALLHSPSAAASMVTSPIGSAHSTIVVQRMPTIVVTAPRVTAPKQPVRAIAD